MNRILDVASSYCATLARVPAGMTVGELGPRPEKPLELYEFEACPYCRKVREVLCELDLDYLSHPVAHGSQRRKQLVQRVRHGGQVRVESKVGEGSVFTLQFPLFDEGCVPEGEAGFDER